MELPEEFTIKVHPTHDHKGDPWYCANLFVPKGAHIVGNTIGISVWRRQQNEAVRAVMWAVCVRLSEEAIRSVVADSKEFVERDNT
jgi:hypothetical protein